MSIIVGDFYNGTGFGAAVADGYGVNYCLGKKTIKVIIVLRQVWY
jgi:hypothetical protein